LARAASRSEKSARTEASAPLRRGRELLAVDLQEEVALLDDVALAHGQVDDLAHDVGGEIDLALRVDLPVRRDLARQIVRSTFAERDGRPLLALRANGRGGDAADEEERDDTDDDLRSAFHAGTVIRRDRSWVSDVSWSAAAAAAAFVC
jgi:hypothetical protein